MRRFTFLLSFIFFVSFSLQASDLYPWENERQKAQFNHLLHELRCLVCQNQDLADSNAPLAIDLKNEIYAMVKSGQSDYEITNYLTERYGDFILFNPPVKGLTMLLWFGPFLFLMLGFWIYWHTCLKRSSYE